MQADRHTPRPHPAPTRGTALYRPRFHPVPPGAGKPGHDGAERESEAPSTRTGVGRQPAPAPRSTRNGPIARASRLPCKNDRTASSGEQTIGSSCMLNEVLMIVGVPVRRR